MKIKFAAILFLAFLSLSWAQLPPGQKAGKVVNALPANGLERSTESILKKDYSTDNRIYQRKFRADFRKNYRGTSFRYESSRPRVSLWQRLSEYIEMLINKLFGKTYNKAAGDTTFLILKILAFAVCGFLVYFLINYFMRKNGLNFFGKKNQKTTLKTRELAEDIHEINFSEAIAAAETAQDYRSAVRYRFLNILKTLSDYQIIRWNPEKTNQDYIRELRDAAMAEKFRRLAYIYDYVWYGEFEISATEYARLRAGFEENILKP